MDSPFPLIRPRQRVPMIDAGTLEDRTRPPGTLAIADERHLRVVLGAPEDGRLLPRRRGLRVPRPGPLASRSGPFALRPRSLSPSPGRLHG